MKRYVVFASLIAMLGFVFANTSIVGNVASVIQTVDASAESCLAELALKSNSNSNTYSTQKERINGDSQDDIIFKGTNEELCGSAGCIHELCISDETGFTIASFGYAADTLIVKDSLTNDMHDLRLVGKSTTDLIWDGTRYNIAE